MYYMFHGCKYIPLSLTLSGLTFLLRVGLFVSWGCRKVLEKSMFLEKSMPVDYALSLRDFVVVL